MNISAFGVTAATFAERVRIVDAGPDTLVIIDCDIRLNRSGCSASDMRRP